MKNKIVIYLLITVILFQTRTKSADINTGPKKITIENRSKHTLTPYYEFKLKDGSKKKYKEQLKTSDGKNKKIALLPNKLIHAQTSNNPKEIIKGIFVESKTSIPDEPSETTDEPIETFIYSNVINFDNKNQIKDNDVFQATDSADGIELKKIRSPLDEKAAKEARQIMPKTVKTPAEMAIGPTSKKIKIINRTNKIVVVPYYTSLDIHKPEIPPKLKFLIADDKSYIALQPQHIIEAYTEDNPDGSQVIDTIFVQEYGKDNKSNVLSFKDYSLENGDTLEITQVGDKLELFKKDKE